MGETATASRKGSSDHEFLSRAVSSMCNVNESVSVRPLSMAAEKCVRDIISEALSALDCPLCAIWKFRWSLRMAEAVGVWNRGRLVGAGQMGFELNDYVYSRLLDQAEESSGRLVSMILPGWTGSTERFIPGDYRVLCLRSDSGDPVGLAALSRDYAEALKEDVREALRRMLARCLETMKVGDVDRGFRALLDAVNPPDAGEALCMPVADTIRHFMSKVKDSGLFVQADATIRTSNLQIICRVREDKIVLEVLDERFGECRLRENVELSSSELVEIVIPVRSQQSSATGVIRAFCDPLEAKYIRLFERELRLIGCLLGNLIEHRVLVGKNENLRNRLSFLQDVTQKVALNLDLGYVLTETVKRAADVVGAKHAWLSLVRKETTVLQPDAFVGLDWEYFNSIRVTWDDSVTGQGPSGKAIKTKRPQIIADTQTDPEFSYWRDEAVKRGYRSILAVPLLFDGQALGMVAVYSSQPNAFGEAEVELLQTFANVAAVAIKHAYTFEELKKTLTERQAMYELAEARSQVLEDSLHVFKELTSLLVKNKGIPAIAKKLADLTGNCVVVEDSFFDLIAVAGSADQAANMVSVRPLIEGKGFAEQKRTLLRDLQPTVFPAVPAEGHSRPRLVAPIVVGEEVWGYVSFISESHEQRFEASDIMVIDKVAMVLAMAFIKEKTAVEVEQRMGRSILKDLLRPDAAVEDVSIRARCLGYDLSKPSYLIALDLSSFLHGHHQLHGDAGLGLVGLKALEIASSTLRSSQLPFVLALDNQALFILSQAKDQYLESSVLPALERALQTCFGNQAFAIILGGLCRSLAELRQVCAEVSELLEVIRLLGVRTGIVRRGDFPLYLLLYKVYKSGDLGWMKGLVERNLGALLRRDNNNVLIQTLSCYLEHGMHLQDTAKALFIHPNTLRYRLRTIEDALGADLRDPSISFNLLLAVKAHELLAALSRGSSLAKPGGMP